MSQSTIVTLLPQTTYSGAQTITGEPKQAAGYYLGNGDSQTITWSLNAFDGKLSVQATLVEEPSATDWFNVYDITSGSTSPVTENSVYNIEGTFVWIRVQINLFRAGIVRHVKVSY
jgi:hypothetical protein